MNLTVVIATYNECENIETLLHRLFELKLPFEDKISVVVIDDGSQDGTQDILHRLAAQYKDRLHIEIRNVRNRGTAAIAGFKRALLTECDFIMEMDGDLSHKPEYIPQFLAMVRHYDVVIGSRYVEGGYVSGWSLSRMVVSVCSNVIYRLVLGTKIHDLSGGFKCYRRNVIESLNLEDFFSRGYSIGVETLFRCHKNGHTFLEIPIGFRNRYQGKSKFKFREAAEALWVICRLIFTHGRAIRLQN